MAALAVTGQLAPDGAVEFVQLDIDTGTLDSGLDAGLDPDD